MSADKLEHEPFAYRAAKDGTVFVDFHGRAVTTLRGRAADRFLRRVGGISASEAQVEMARVTGNFKRGNERRAGDAEDAKG
jgi:hypothetical protein